MKRYAVIVIMCALVMMGILTARTCRADAVEIPEWVRTVRKGAYMYTRDNASGKNKLMSPPQGYYLKVSEEKGNYYKVVIYDPVEPRYMKWGYMLKEDVIAAENVVLPVYPEVTAEGIKGVYAAPDLKGFLRTEGEAVYYGEYGEGEEKLYYVRVGNIYGYVRAEEVSFEVPEHPTEVPEKPEEKDPIEKLTEPTEINDTLAMIIFVSAALCFGVLLSWTMLRRK